LADWERNTKHGQEAARKRSGHGDTPFNAGVAGVLAAAAVEAELW
jgi:hypothetical protein